MYGYQPRAQSIKSAIVGGGGGPSVALDVAAGNLVTGANNLIPVSLTVAAGSNRALVFLIGNGADLTVSSIAYTAGSGGTWARLGGTSNAGLRELEIWSSVAPSTGAVTVQVTMSGNVTPSDGVGVLYSLQNVDQGTPLDGYASNEGAVTISTTLSSGGMVLGQLIAQANAAPILVGSEDYSNATNEFWKAGHNSGSGTLTWTSVSANTMDICNVRKA